MTSSPRRPLWAFCACALLLCAVPLGFSLSGWQWHNAADAQLPLPALLLITETGTMPYAVFTALLLTAVLCRYRQWLSCKALLCLIALSILFTQAEQHLLKPHFALPRPYIALINQEEGRSNRDFYALSEWQQQALVANWHQRQDKDAWLSAHRVHEIAYRFPSGHSLFSASWALLFAFCCSSSALMVAVGLWSAAVMASRVWLGMHLPADLFAGIAFSFFTNGILIAMFIRYLKDRPPVPAQSPHPPR